MINVRKSDECGRMEGDAAGVSEDLCEHPKKAGKLATQLFGSGHLNISAMGLGRNVCVGGFTRVWIPSTHVKAGCVGPCL